MTNSNKSRYFDFSPYLEGGEVWASEHVTEFVKDASSVLISTLNVDFNSMAKLQYHQAWKCVDEWTLTPHAKNQAMIFGALKDWCLAMKPFTRTKQKKMCLYLSKIEDFLKEQEAFCFGVKVKTGFVHLCGDVQLIQSMIQEELLLSRDQLARTCDSFLIAFSQINEHLY